MTAIAIDETSSGGLVQIPGYSTVATTNYNPITEHVTDVPGSKEAFDVGVRWMSNSTGLLTRGYRLVDGNLAIGDNASDNSFAYANGIGELVALCDAAPIEIGNRVWEDLNGNGVQDPAERGLQGVAVELLAQDANGAYTILAGSAETGVDGDYAFGGLSPNTQYRVRLALADKYLLTVNDAATGPSADAIDSDAIKSDNDAIIDLKTGAAGENNHTYDIGLKRRLGVGNLVWFDADNNGARDAGEAGVAGVAVELLDASNTVVLSTTTSGSGEYQFVGLTPGVYAVQIRDLPAGFISSTGANSAYEGTNTPSPDDGIDNDDNGTTISPGLIRSKPVELTSALEINDGDDDPNNNPSLDFGVLTPNLSLGDYVWLDLDKDGVQDDGENGVEGVTVRLFADANADGVPDASLPIAIKTTDASGKYLFTDLAPSSYVLEFAAPSGFSLTGKNAGADTNRDSDADPISGRTGSIALDVASNLSVDAGLIGGSIGNFVWIDQDRDGQQDAGEPGIPGAIVTLHRPNGAPIATTTSISGAYLFRGLPSGTYSLTITFPQGYALTEQNIGSDDTDSDFNAEGATAPITLIPGQDLLTVDAGAVTGVQIVKSSNRPNQSLRRGDFIIYSIDITNLGDTAIQGCLAGRSDPSKHAVSGRLGHALASVAHAAALDIRPARQRHAALQLHRACHGGAVRQRAREQHRHVDDRQPPHRQQRGCQPAAVDRGLAQPLLGRRRRFGHNDRVGDTGRAQHTGLQPVAQRDRRPRGCDQAQQQADCIERAGRRWRLSLYRCPAVSRGEVLA